MKHFIRPLFLIFLVFLTNQTLQSQTIFGKVTNGHTGEAQPFATLVFYDDVLVSIAEVTTDSDGNYKVPLDSSAVWIEAHYPGFAWTRLRIPKRKKVDIAMMTVHPGLICISITPYRKSIVDLEWTSSGQIFTSEQIRNSAY